jgi:lipoprotein-anchoring transpeptidase ErfK/SrfK
MRRLLAIPVLALLAAGCGAAQRSAPETERVAGAQAVRCAPAYRSLASTRVAYAAIVRERATAFRAPGGRGFARFGRLNVNDYPTVFGVRGELVGPDCAVRWYSVQLPIKPNGVTGWVRAADVDLARVRTRIVVDLSARRVTLYEGGRPALSSPAAVGAPATPTPTGSFYVNQRLVPADPSGPFGPGALGISAYSDVLTGWTQGGPVAIHGTNTPASIGRAVSNGCIRVPNDVLERLFKVALAGTPVVVRA